MVKKLIMLAFTLLAIGMAVPSTREQIGDSVTPIKASPNYWGHHDGPSGQGAGMGDAVGVNVLYSPWWADEAMTILAYESDAGFSSDYTVGRGETLDVPGTLDISGGAVVDTATGPSDPVAPAKT